MRDYGKVRTAFWTDDRVSELSNDGKLLALYLMTSPHSNAVGCYRLPAGYVSDDIGWERDRVEATFRELAAVRFALRCARTGWTLIVNYLRHNEIENGNVGKACVRMLDQVPASIPFAADLVKCLEPSRERFPEGFLERYAERFGDGMPTPEPNLNQNHSVEAGASTGAAGAAIQADPTDKDLVWGNGLAWLRKETSLTDRRARELVGRWCKGGREALVLALMRECRAHSPPIIEPIPWIEAALAERSQHNDRPHRTANQSGPQRTYVENVDARRGGILDALAGELGIGCPAA